MIREWIGVVVADVLASSIRMMDELSFVIGDPSERQGLVQGPQVVFGPHVVGHRPADDAARVHVEDQNPVIMAAL